MENILHMFRVNEFKDEKNNPTRETPTNILGCSHRYQYLIKNSIKCAVFSNFQISLGLNSTPGSCGKEGLSLISYEQTDT